MAGKATLQNISMNPSPFQFFIPPFKEKGVKIIEMASNTPLKCLQPLFLLSFLCLKSLAITNPPSPRIKSVNLGGWLVTEGWMTPSLFDGIPNNDLLDGTRVQFRSLAQNKYITAENGGGQQMVATRTSASDWETFKLWRVTSTRFEFKVFNNQFMGLDDQNMGLTGAWTTNPGPWETFEIVRHSNADQNRVRLRSQNGLFVQAKPDGSVMADGPANDNWGDNEWSVFSMTIISSLRGEYQVTNGYGRDRAQQVMTQHWNSYIGEDDFRFMSQNGINAVRIPVGYWIIDDNPPAPFVGGSLAALDNAFTWAANHGIKVIVDLHAAPGSQNGNDHSGSRDGTLEWGKTQQNIDQTVAVVDFLASRYATRPSFLALELLNEPTAPGVSLDSLKNYYQAGYNAVRKYSSSCYVIMSNRLSISDTTELLEFAGRLDGTVIDVHYYNLFNDGLFKGMNVQQNIDFVNNQRVSDLSTVTRSNGPPVFIGEWTAEWDVGGASKEDYQRFAAAELKVFGQATFGWAYWSWKNVNDHWSLEWMINNGYMSL